MSNPSAAEFELPPPEPVAPVRERWLLHVGLFVATFACVAGLQWLSTQSVRDALMFTAALLAILTCHEFGHYFAGKYYGVSISPPYFIPLPLPIGIGTLGAVIQIRTLIPTRNALVDIGAAGPIAGMVLGIPLLFWGTAHSHYAPVVYEAGIHLPGRASLWSAATTFAHAFQLAGGTLGARFSAGGHALGALLSPEPPVFWSGDCLLTWIPQRLFLGPRPPGQDLFLHPVAFAGWWACLVTMLNLFPIGQTDGGHVTAALFGKKAEWIGHGMHLSLLALIVFASPSWIGWLLVTRYLVGVRHPPVTQPQEPLSASRYVIALVSLVLLVLTFIPVPFETRGGP
ncbi:MAG: site-2 protease family protein [Deltaproteobacteria bacterium]|nr:site-2 protease family protein [Deltaproteobacteria bacterium]